jgi:sulfatase maturation enzyme AslB (radical SAM superfamily)
MKFHEQIEQLQKQYNIVNTVDLDHWHTMAYEDAQRWLRDTVKRLWKEKYDANDRLIFVLKHGDVYVENSELGLILKNLQIAVNKQDISNYFIMILSNTANIENQLTLLKSISTDPVAMTGIYCDEINDQVKKVGQHPADNKEIYHYGSVDPWLVSLNTLTDREQFLLTKSKRFCILPWIHLHAYPTGEAYPCCHSESVPGKIGNTRTQTLAELWNSPVQRKLRSDMLDEKPNPACTRCYEQESSGFFSGRRSANKHHGHQIDRVAATKPDGSVEQFEMTYWDIRFSNLCNLSCRSCGHTFSSSWYQDQAKLAGPEWKKTNQVLNYSGRTATDMWEQLIPHLDYVDQIYFAGGEPLMMAEHYNILDELERRGKFYVRLTYNTNFTQTRLKDRPVFDYWKKFKNTSVGASLDGMGSAAEYVRKGTKWLDVVKNRHDMIRTCPGIDFYVSSTLSIMNAWHLPDFHKEWVSAGLIQAKDFNVNILQGPAHYRIDIAPPEFKAKLEAKYLKHLDWLSDRDPLQRATQGFRSAIEFMNATDNTHLIDKFWSKTHELDKIRNENILDIFPELAALK